MRSPEDTIAALATPLGSGGIGVIRVSGPDAIMTISKIFHGQDLASAASHHCYVGTIGAPTPIDEVVVTLFRAPHSYTGEDVVEISAHGNPLTLRKILDLCHKNGARPAGPGEFTERAFLNGKLDLTQAEAVADFISAQSEKAHTAALSQLQGRLSEKIRALRDGILPLLAHMEVSLDHSDEPHGVMSREQMQSTCHSLAQDLDRLLASKKVSKWLREGFRVSLAGRPNVGKSSLLNALLKEERAIVTPIAGTTRDTLEERLEVNGISVVLTDTAGLRATPIDPVEKIGMERTGKSLERADAVIGLFDGSQPLSPEDEYVVAQAKSKPHVWVINKSDLPQALNDGAFHQFNGDAPVIRLSAKTGEGIEQLASALVTLALKEEAPGAEAEWILNNRHEAALIKAREALEGAAHAATQESYEECVALELRAAIDALGEIIGETSTEALLGEIFSRFCIGK